MCNNPNGASISKPDGRCRGCIVRWIYFAYRDISALHALHTLILSMVQGAKPVKGIFANFIRQCCSFWVICGHCLMVLTFFNSSTYVTQTFMNTTSLTYHSFYIFLLLYCLHPMIILCTCYGFSYIYISVLYLYFHCCIDPLFPIKRAQLWQALQVMCTTRADRELI